jgi:Flp pilus assembly protein TadD
MAKYGAQRKFGMALCAFACASCTRQVQTASLPAPIPAVSAVMARQVKNAADAGEGDVELRRLRQHLAANAKDPDARIQLARYYSSRGLPDLALEHYRLAAEQFPNSVEVTMALAKTLREMGEPSEALSVVRSYVDRQPHGSWEALSLEGILEDEQGLFPAAEKAHRAALELAPQQSALHNNLGLNLLSQVRIDPAVDEFRRAIELDPKSEVAHNNLAAALASRSGAAPKEALQEWRRSRSQAEAHNNMAAVLIEQRRFTDARAELDIALGFEPGLPAALSNLRLVAQMDGQPATIPARQARRRASLWSRLFGSKPAASGSESTSASSGQPGTASTDASLKK